MALRAALVAAASAACLYAQSFAPQVVQTDPIPCGGLPLNYTELVTPTFGRNFGITIAATTPPGVTQMALLDQAVYCLPCVGVSECTLWNWLTPLLVFGLPTGPNSVVLSLPVSGQLLNMPFAVQFQRLVAPGTTGLANRVPTGVLNFGPAYEVVLAGAPMPRDAKEPAHVGERALYYETDSQQQWLPFLASNTYRMALLEEFVPGVTFVPQGGKHVVTLPNGATLVVDGPGGGMRPLAAPQVYDRVEALAALVEARWGHLGYHLRMTSAKREPNPAKPSFHQYGRGCDLSLADASYSKLTVPGSSQPAHLGRLARLAREAGFDWVWHEPGTTLAEDHVHASVGTGAPTVTIDCVSAATFLPALNSYQWQVNVTATDPDGVWRIHAVASAPNAATPWGALNSVGYDSDVTGEIPPTTKSTTLTVRAPAAMASNGQVRLHVWARDTFGGSPATATSQPIFNTPSNGPPPSAVVPDPSLNMVAIAPGTFVMGSNESIYQPPHWNGPESRPAHQVTITRPFWIGKYEVSQAQYQAVMGSNPSYFQGANFPVESVSWFAAKQYCAALTALEAQQGRVPADYAYRLPTEAEWEYCCRAGTTTEYAWPFTIYQCDPAVWNSSSESGLPCSVANSVILDFATCSSVSCLPGGAFGTAPVSSYAPNAFGLHQMHGNVWEWCEDGWYGVSNYSAAAVTDPFVASGPSRVVRGGGWTGGSSSCRSAVRNGYYPAYSDYCLGFRVVLAPVLCH